MKSLWVVLLLAGCTTNITLTNSRLPPVPITTCLLLCFTNIYDGVDTMPEAQPMDSGFGAPPKNLQKEVYPKTNEARR